MNTSLVSIPTDTVTLEGVTITAYQGGSSKGSVQTTATGTYFLTDLAPGTYELRPSKSNHIFTPLNRMVTITTANRVGQDFTARATVLR